MAWTLTAAILLASSSACEDDPSYVDSDWSRLPAKQVCERVFPLVDEDLIGQPVRFTHAQEQDDTAWPRCYVSSVDRWATRSSTVEERESESLVELAFYPEGETDIDVDQVDIWFGDCEQESVDEHRGVWHVYGMHCGDDAAISQTLLLARGPYTGLRLEVTAPATLDAFSLEESLALLDGLLQLSWPSGDGSV